MQVKAFRITDSDIRYFRTGDGYRVGHYLEQDKPSPHNSTSILVVYRVPEGTQAPVGRLTPETLQQLADQGLREVEPEVIARYPFWSYIEENGAAIDMPDDTKCEDIAPLPPSAKDGKGHYILPPFAYEPLKTAEKPKPAATEAKVAAEDKQVRVKDTPASAPKEA